MNEAEAKRRIVENIKARGGYARRIEDNFSVGFPDLIVQTSSELPVFFIEAKLTGFTSFGPTPRQYVEMNRLAVSRYAIPLLAGWSNENGVWYLHRRAEIALIPNCFVQPDGLDFFDTLEAWYLQEMAKGASHQ